MKKNKELINAKYLFMWLERWEGGEMRNHTRSVHRYSLDYYFSYFTLFINIPLHPRRKHNQRKKCPQTNPKLQKIQHAKMGFINSGCHNEMIFLSDSSELGELIVLVA